LSFSGLGESAIFLIAGVIYLSFEILGIKFSI
jgi:hypothetical protein